MRTHAVAVMLASLIPSAPLPAQAPVTVSVSADQVRLRAGPATSAKVVAILGKGTTVTVLERGSEWARVRVGFTTGYVHSSLLGNEAPAPTQSADAAAAPAPSQMVPTQGVADPSPSATPTPSRAPQTALPSTQASHKAFSVHGGLANGSGGWGIGFGGGLGYALPVGGAPIAVRIQAEFYHFQDSEEAFGVSASASSNLIGANGVAEYAFRTSSDKLVPYVVGGLGLYYQSVSAEATVPGVGSGAADDSETSLAAVFGGGLRFGERFFAELRFAPFFSGGSVIPMTIGMRF